MHEEFEDLAALASVGGATEAELDRLTEHMNGCRSCDDAYHDYREAAAMLAFGLDPVAPPASLRSAILEIPKRNDQEDEDESTVDSNVEAVVHPWVPIRRMVPAWSLAAAATFFLALFGWSELRLRAMREEVQELRAQSEALSEDKRRLEERTALMSNQVDAMSSASRSINLVGQPIAPTAAARVFLDAPQRQAFVFFSNLPQIDNTQSYQLWVIPKQAGSAPMSAGVFEARNGKAFLRVENLPVETEIAALAVTIEPRGGVPAPTGEKVLVGTT